VPTLEGAFGSRLERLFCNPQYILWVCTQTIEPDGASPVEISDDVSLKPIIPSLRAFCLDKRQYSDPTGPAHGMIAPHDRDEREKNEKPSRIHKEAKE
jgi:hypothetical protein